MMKKLYLFISIVPLVLSLSGCAKAKTNEEPHKWVPWRTSGPWGENLIERHPTHRVNLEGYQLPSMND